MCAIKFSFFFANIFSNTVTAKRFSRKWCTKIVRIFLKYSIMSFEIYAFSRKCKNSFTPYFLKGFRFFAPFTIFSSAVPQIPLCRRMLRAKTHFCSYSTGNGSSLSETAAKVDIHCITLVQTLELAWSGSLSPCFVTVSEDLRNWNYSNTW